MPGLTSISVLAFTFLPGACLLGLVLVKGADLGLSTSSFGGSAASTGALEVPGGNKKKSPFYQLMRFNGLHCQVGRLINNGCGVIGADRGGAAELTWLAV